MTDIDPWLEQKLADLSREDFEALRHRVRPPDETTDPKIVAARALRKSRGADRTTKATKDQAAAALRSYSSGTRTN